MREVKADGRTERHEHKGVREGDALFNALPYAVAHQGVFAVEVILVDLTLIHRIFVKHSVFRYRSTPARLPLVSTRSGGG